MTTDKYLFIPMDVPPDTRLPALRMQLTTQTTQITIFSRNFYYNIKNLLLRVISIAQQFG
jgi:hypothetical protein